MFSDCNILRILHIADRIISVSARWLFHTKGVHTYFLDTHTQQPKRYNNMMMYYTRAVCNGTGHLLYYLYYMHVKIIAGCTKHAEDEIIGAPPNAKIGCISSSRSCAHAAAVTLIDVLHESPSYLPLMPTHKKKKKILSFSTYTLYRDIVVTKCLRLLSFSYTI